MEAWAGPPGASLERTVVSYLPLITTLLAAAFGPVLYRHWRSRPAGRHVFWWFIGVVAYGLGTAAEGMTTLVEWNEPMFRLWYVTGALMGGVFLALGTVHLLLRPATAARHTRFVLGYVAVAATVALMSPLQRDLAEPFRLSAEVLEWTWVRGLSPLINTYAFVYLVGGAAWSAWRYARSRVGAGRRVLGNILIAVGAVLPGIGGISARQGRVEVLYVTELIGLALIWAGYAQFRDDTTPSIHVTRRRAAADA